MNRLTLIKYLNSRLLKEMPQLEIEDVPDDLTSQRKLLRALMNIRPPMPLDKNFLRLQDELLSAEVAERGVVKISDVPNVAPHIKIWRGDITRLEVDAIVNDANEKLLGCFIPLHGCIDNAIHSAAGLQLREACQKIMEAHGVTTSRPVQPKSRPLSTCRANLLFIPSDRLSRPNASRLLTKKICLPLATNLA